MQIPMHSNSIGCPKIVSPSAPVFYWLSHLTCRLSMKVKNRWKTLIFHTAKKKKKSPDTSNTFSLFLDIHRQGHALDWVIIRPDEGIHQSTQLSNGLESDHCCVLVQFDVSVSCPPPVHPLVHNIRGIDHVAFKRDLEAELCSLMDPSADQYNATLRSVLDKHAPAAKRKVTNRVSSPWFSLVSEELLQAKRSRRQAERQWRASGLVVHKKTVQEGQTLCH